MIVSPFQFACDRGYRAVPPVTAIPSTKIISHNNIAAGYSMHWQRERSNIPPTKPLITGGKNNAFITMNSFQEPPGREERLKQVWQISDNR